MSRALIPAPLPGQVIDGEIVAEPLSQTDYERLRDALALRRWDYALLCKVLRATGIRLSEALALTPERIGQNGPDTWILIKRGKKRGERVWERMYMPPQLAGELRSFIQGGHILPGVRLWGMTRRQVWWVFKQESEKTLGRRVHPHELRKLYGQTLIDGGVNVEVTAKLLGHADPKTTLQWYYDLSFEKRAEIARRMQV